jgi:transcriptional regulator with XRE-family HTH domain
MNQNCIPTAHEFMHTLRHLRINIGPTQKEMAKILGISPAYYNDLERGRRLPSLRIADAIARFECDRRSFDHERAWFIRLWHGLAAKAHGWRIG